MRNKKKIILTIILILAMVIMTVSTSQSPPREIKNSISYETRGEYFLIKIRTRIDPDNYTFFGSSSKSGSFYIFFEGRKEGQYFYKNIEGHYVTLIIRPYDFEESILLDDEEVRYFNGEHLIITKSIILDDEDFGTFIEGRHFIIRIKNEIIMFDNPRVSYGIMLSRNDGRYIHQIYRE
ncbi:MAG: hypothetical protein LBI28_11385 [Treponema sp.]|jgi:hypothetical protein|nr:hypothetical protein [Treponema sp.]